MRKGKYEYWQSEVNHNWYWHLKAANHKVIMQSEGYTSKEGCLDGIYAMRSAVSVRDKLLIRVSRDKRLIRLSNDDRYYFIIKAVNQEVLGTSQMYKFMAGCKKGHAAVMINRSTEKVAELA